MGASKSLILKTFEGVSRSDKIAAKRRYWRGAANRVDRISRFARQDTRWPTDDGGEFRSDQLVRRRRAAAWRHALAAVGPGEQRTAGELVQIPVDDPHVPFERAAGVVEGQPSLVVPGIVRVDPQRMQLRGNVRRHVS